LIVVIILGIPSTLIASEYWMSTGLNPNGNLHPQLADIELANYFSDIPTTSRVAVYSYDSNALVRLAGVATAVSRTYLNISEVDRPETMALISSDVRYFVLDKTNDLEQNSELFDYLPIVFNNTKYTVYYLPVLQYPNANSSVGYIAPTNYNGNSLLSFLLFSSLNISYQVVTEKICDKSVIILPDDYVESKQNISDDYFLDTLQTLKWVSEGGKLIVFGGEGYFFKSLGLTISYSNSTIDSIGSTRGSGLSLLNPIISNIILLDNTTEKVMNYYESNGNKVCPFAIKKEIGKGTIIYLYTNPLLLAAQSNNCQIFYPELLSIISNTLNIEHFSENKKLWISQYESYANNDFTAEGTITINSKTAGTQFLHHEVEIENLVLDNTTFPTNSNFTISKITIDGDANILIKSTNVTSNEAIIPNHFLMETTNCSILLESINNGAIEIVTDNGTFICRTIYFTSKNATLVMENPVINVDGHVLFKRISLPENSAPWSTDVNLNGNTSFHINYGDSDYLFFDQYDFPIWQQNSPQQPILPLAIFYSTNNLVIIFLFVFFYLIFRKKHLHISII